MIELTFLQGLLVTLLLTHITIVSVTLYLHRSQAHRSVAFSPVISHPMRLWLWLSTGMNTREWVAVHRKHHQAADTSTDPHSPKIYGIWRVLFGGAWLYVKAKQDPKVIKLGVGTPNDWVERKIYTAHPYLGIMLMLIIDLVLFGFWGLLVWGVQMIWIPIWAAGVINGLAHWIGYRNYDVKDTSRNIFPFGIWIGGEELHNNHHGAGASAKFSTKWWEIDIGWLYIKVLAHLRLAKIKNN